MKCGSPENDQRGSLLGEEEDNVQASVVHSESIRVPEFSDVFRGFGRRGVWQKCGR